MAVTPTAYNPYRHLANALRVQLKLEEQMVAEDRERISWMVRVEFAGESMTLGKGGTNTCFWFRNSGERKVGYPNDALALLNKLARQDHVLYLVTYANGSVKRTSMLSGALKHPPRKGAHIQGTNIDGSMDPLYRARTNVAGKLSWIAGKK